MLQTLVSEAGKGHASDSCFSLHLLFSGHAVSSQILQQGPGVSRGEQEGRVDLFKGKQGRIWRAGQGRATPPLGEAGSPSLHRNGVSESSRTWSLPRRWRKMMTTASLEPGLGEGWAEWRLAFVFSLRGPLPGNLASFSHTQLTDCICAGVRDAGSQLFPSWYHASL